MNRLWIVALIVVAVAAVAARAQTEDGPAAEGDKTASASTQKAPATQPAKADQIDSAWEKWYDKLVAAGWTIAALLIMSVVGVAFLLERLVNLRRSVIVPAGLAARVDTLWKQGKVQQAEQLTENSQSTLGRTLHYLIAHRNASVSDLSTGCADVAARDLRRHLLKAYPLLVIGTLAPLLGLLGTVSGMVDAFDTVALAGLGDVQLLGDDISKALVTTLVGLIVAIPTLIAYHFFQNRTNLYGVVLEEQVTTLVSEWLMKPAPAAEETTSDDA